MGADIPAPRSDSVAFADTQAVRISLACPARGASSRARKPEKGQAGPAVFLPQPVDPRTKRNSNSLYRFTIHPIAVAT